jgi:hypothetical protein
MPAGEQFKRNYPGLIPEAAAVWRRWLVDHELEFLSFEYNVRVGEGVRPSSASLTGDEALDAKMREWFRQLTQKRIDVVAHRPKEIWIIEIAVRPGPRELGQLLLYEELLGKLQEPETITVHGRTRTIAPRPIQLGLVCERLGADMEVTIRRNGIEIWQLGVQAPPPPPPRPGPGPRR